MANTRTHILKNGEVLLVRPAVGQDTAEVMEFFAAVFAQDTEMLAVYDESPESFTMDALWRRLNRYQTANNGLLLTAWLDDKVVGIADIHGALYNEKGFDVPKVIDWVYGQRKPLPEFPGGGAKMDQQEILFQPCDILLPAAIENQITSKNAHRVQARILCEGANGPTTAPADEILLQKDVFVIPDILANAGGVTVSYFEWVQNRTGYFWNEADVNNRLQEIMVSAFQDVTNYGRSKRIDNRQAAYMVALERVVYAIRLRGLYA